MPIDNSAFVYRVTFIGKVLGEQALNMFYYGGPDEATDLAALAVAVKEAVWNPLRLILSGAAQLDTVSIEGVKGSNLFTSVAPLELGAVAGDCLPPYASWGFELVRAGVGERNGYKRFGGVAETSQTNGFATSGVIANIPDITDGLEGPITTADGVFDPLIRRTRVHKVIQNPPTYWSVGAAIFQGITTQSSRKFGHGS